MNKFEVSDKLAKIITELDRSLKRDEYATDFDMQVQYEEGLHGIWEMVAELKGSI